ncbi:MAG TPA: hypothetical protein VK636_19065 [Gemmatimonadaceae bacterium]|nr:hypothetical protein [Gemmatimonadaceae bacterium]
MDQFNYLAVLISIILGLGITQLLSGFGRLLQGRQRVRLYWPTLAWVGLLLVLHVQTWWAMFGLRTLRSWSFLGFLLVLLQPIVLYLLSALALPDANSETATDLRAHYYAHSRWFFGFAVALLVVSLTRDRVLAGSLPGSLNIVGHVLLFLGWGIAAITRRETYHRWVAVFTIVLLVGYIAVLFSRLQ